MARQATEERERKRASERASERERERERDCPIARADMRTVHLYMRMAGTPCHGSKRSRTLRCVTTPCTSPPQRSSPLAARPCRAMLLGLLSSCHAAMACAQDSRSIFDDGGGHAAAPPRPRAPHDGAATGAPARALRHLHLTAIGSVARGMGGLG